jgi:hypothetical protein
MNGYHACASLNALRVGMPVSTACYRVLLAAPDTPGELISSKYLYIPTDGMLTDA